MVIIHNYTYYDRMNKVGVIEELVRADMIFWGNCTHYHL